MREFAQIWKVRSKAVVASCVARGIAHCVLVARALDLQSKTAKAVCARSPLRSVDPRLAPKTPTFVLGHITRYQPASGAPAPNAGLNKKLAPLTERLKYARAPRQLAIRVLCSGGSPSRRSVTRGERSLGCSTGILTNISLMRFEPICAGRKYARSSPTPPIPAPSRHHKHTVLPKKPPRTAPIRQKNCTGPIGRKSARRRGEPAKRMVTLR